jgi:hypothetical protein
MELEMIVVYEEHRGTYQQWDLLQRNYETIMIMILGYEDRVLCYQMCDTVNGI